MKFFSVVHVYNWICQYVVHAPLEITVLCICTTEFFSVVHVHNSIFQFCACAQLEISVLCTCTIGNCIVVHVHNCYYSTLSFSQHLSMLCAHTTWICLVHNTDESSCARAQHCNLKLCTCTTHISCCARAQH